MNMKALFLSAAFSILGVMAIQAQAWQKGNSNIDIGIELAGYGSEVSYQEDRPGSEVIRGEKDGAASLYIPISYEYGIGEKIGIGAELAFSNYFLDPDSNDVNSVNGVDFSLLVNYHFLDSEKHDLMIGLLLGGSSVNWDFDDGNTLKGSGSKFSLYLKDRIMFSEQIGMLLHLGYVSYTYDKVDSSKSDVTLKSLDWKLGGVNFGTGLALRF